MSGSTQQRQFLLHHSNERIAPGVMRSQPVFNVDCLTGHRRFPRNQLGNDLMIFFVYFAH